MKTKTTSKPKTEAPAFAVKFARNLQRKNYGTVTIVRATTQHFPTLKRRAILAVAAELKLNLGTAARQYQEVRSGNIRIEEL